jgi:hypothetical protein
MERSERRSYSDVSSLLICRPSLYRVVGLVDRGGLSRLKRGRNEKVVYFLRRPSPHESSLIVWEQFEFNCTSRFNAKVPEDIFRQSDSSPRVDFISPHRSHPPSVQAELRYCKLPLLLTFDQEGDHVRALIGRLVSSFWLDACGKGPRRAHNRLRCLTEVAFS